MIFEPQTIRGAGCIPDRVWWYHRRFGEIIAVVLKIEQFNGTKTRLVKIMDARILVTMEHPKQMKLIGDSLEHYGHCVLKAITFHESMEILRNSEVDLIISDVHLQNGGSVFDFLRWVKGDPHMQAVPFVCYSSEPAEIGKYLADGVRTAARALGAAKYITMEQFDANAFRHEIEWLLPLSRAGSYYAEPAEPCGD